MTDDRSLERAARSWLEEGPTQAPDRPVEAALSRIQTTSQERELALPWRLPTMTPMLRWASVAVVAVLAIGVGVMAFGQTSNVDPTSPPSIGPSAASPSPTAPRSPIADGKYAVDLPVADILAELDSDTTLTSEAKQAIVDEILLIEGATTLHLQVVVAGKQFTLSRGTDGSAMETDFTWRMTVIDEHTVEFSAPEGPTNARYVVVPGSTAGSFTLRPLVAAGEPVPTFVWHTLFQTAPYVPVP